LAEEDAERDPKTLSYFRNAKLEFKHDLLHVLLKHVLWDINQLMPRVCRDFLFLHSGAVASPEGAILLPAPADHGKSTLVAALLRGGFSYMSDEYGVIDPVTARAYPYPRFITLDQATVERFGGLEERLEDLNGRGGDKFTRFVRPEDLGAAAGPPSRIRSLIFLAEERDGSPRLQALPKAEVVESMAANCMNLYRYGERGVVLFSRVAADVKAFRLTGGSETERAELLGDRFLS
jgi:hypothetical protein